MLWLQINILIKKMVMVSMPEDPAPAVDILPCTMDQNGPGKYEKQAADLDLQITRLL